MSNGAVMLLEKPIDPEELWRHVSCQLDLACQAAAERRRLTTIREAIDGLSPGQREVLAGLLSGRANKVMASDLGVSERAIEVRRAKVMNALGVDSVAGLVRTVMAARPELAPPLAGKARNGTDGSPR